MDFWVSFLVRLLRTVVILSNLRQCVENIPEIDPKSIPRAAILTESEPLTETCL